MAGSVATAEIGGCAESIGILLLIVVISGAMYFRKASAATGEECHCVGTHWTTGR